MTVRGYVTFQDELHPVVDVTDDDALPPGRAIADELAQRLEARGVPIVAPVSQWEGYGWEFTVDVDGRAVWFMLQASDNWLLVSDSPRGLMEKIAGLSVELEHKKALEHLAAILTPPRFIDARWFTKADFENQSGTGASAP